MGRLSRIVIPGVPHHVTQRGNRRQSTFFSDADGLRTALTEAHRRYSSRVNAPFLERRV